MSSLMSDIGSGVFDRHTCEIQIIQLLLKRDIIENKNIESRNEKTMGEIMYLSLNFERMSFRGSKRGIQCHFRKHNFGERLGQSGGKESRRNKL